MSRFLNKKYETLQAYVPGEQPRDMQYIKLNTNESPFSPPRDVIEAVSKEERMKLRLYSDPDCSDLKDALAKTKVGMWEYDIKILGYKCNMTDIAAAIGLKQLDRYDGMLARRQEIIAQYTAALAPYGLITPTHVTETSTSSGHLYLLRIPEYTEQDRNDLICRMAEREVPTNVHYKPLPMMTAYKDLGFSINDFPNAYAQYQNEITLPLHTLLEDADVSFVAETLIDCWRK